MKDEDKDDFISKLAPSVTFDEHVIILELIRIIHLSFL